MKCKIHGDNCPGDDGGFFMDDNHPDDMFALGGKRMKGRVARVLDLKGFGFILGDDGVEYFIHKDDCQDSFDDLVSDMRTIRDIDVAFEIVASTRGPRAGYVERLYGKS